MTLRQAQGERKGDLDPAAVAAELTSAERTELLRLSLDTYATAPALDTSKRLRFHHGVPLIAGLGDWAKLTRFGAKVCEHLPEGPAS